MKDQLFLLDFLFFNGVSNQLLRQIGTFAVRQHPSDDAATVDIQNHVKVVIGPFFWTLQFGDFPLPDFIGRSGKQFRFLVFGMFKLISPLTGALIVGKNAIHRPHTA